MVTESTTTFGALLRQHRLAAGLTKEQLAERAGMSVFGIQKLERGTTHPYRDTAARLTAALELPPDEAERFRAIVAPVRRRPATPRDAPRTDRHHNLPIALTSFIGREQELGSIPPRLRAARLLTLTGVGGSGKTRLAIELAHTMADAYPGGVWLVELAQVSDPALVPHRLAAVLRVQETAERPLEHALADALRDQQLRLVLDNCEHVVDACAVLVDYLLRECRSLRILATSREPIGVPGEVTWAVAPLAIPDPRAPSASAEIERSPAVRLFVDRAAAVHTEFVLGPENADAVAQICHRLDGLPLALELAAGRLDALTPHELARRLDQRFALLAGGSRVAEPRQQTLSATVDWSYVLLDATQQRVFERLSVFANGWTLDAAEAVCSGDDVAAEDVLDAVLQLVRKSLVVRIDVRSSTARFGLLETLRQYAWDKLSERAAERTATRERHAAYYSALVARLDPAGGTTLLPFSGQAVTTPVYEILDDAQDNVQVALRWWLETRRAAEGLGLVSGLGALWFWNGYPVDGRRWVEAMLDLAASATDSSGVSPAQRAQHANALNFAGMTAQAQGDNARAQSFIDASIALWRALDDPLGLALALVNSSGCYTARGDFEQGEPIAREAVALARTGGEPFTLCTTLATHGLASLMLGQHESAAALLRESIVVGQTIAHASLRAMAGIRSLVWLGRVESERGAADTAIPVFEDALARMRATRMAGYLLGFGVAWMADAYARTGEPAHAARLFGAAEGQLRRANFRFNAVMQLSPGGGVSAAQAQLGQDAFAQAWSEGSAMDAASMYAYALDEPT
jgi:predicted ATPase/DNA-binding XRE family transcriptional regulator